MSHKNGLTFDLTERLQGPMICVEKLRHLSQIECALCHLIYVCVLGTV